MNTITLDILERVYQKALAALLAERHPDGYWVGELSTSALSTATAVSALSLVQKQVPPHNQHASLIAAGLAWLKDHQNDDGAWGDTVKSFSNISTTMLCRAAFHLAGAAVPFCHCLLRADEWLGRLYGNTQAELAEAVRRRYGKDRTFATPILTTCALAGLVSWKEVPPLPFELACFPQSWFRFLRLHVVSYALPALIAIGQAVHLHRPPWNPITRLIRWLARGKSLKVLQAIQPSSGGFLEATPLTSFVTLSLAACGLADHPVARKAVEFLVNSVRPDGSWPIDSNLSTWLTTLSINALATAGELDHLDKQSHVRAWLTGQQYCERHPYTGAAPGGWAWTPLPGGVPDVDDTAGAMLALAQWHSRVGANDIAEPEFRRILEGLRWLLDVQNGDAGWPTFCRGWGRLPFDRSGCDLTAHVLRAFKAWQSRLTGLNGHRTRAAEDDTRVDFWYSLGVGPLHWTTRAGLTFLSRHQRPDGSWLPLWFGNQHAPDDENPTYGTSRVLAAYRDLDMMNTEPARRGVAWLLGAQNFDGGWGGAAGTPSSMEETALAVEILLDAPGADTPGAPAEGAVNKALAWLVQQVEAGGLYQPAPIGFYFAKLWYFEKLYPIIFTVAALGRARRKLSRREREADHPARQDTQP
jgi:squalene-hopene/tetraprenyl-beta-curcumene cyclase